MVNFWDGMTDFLHQFKNGDQISTFANEDEARFRCCYLKLQRDIMVKKGNIITTDSNALKLLAKFVKGTNGVVVMFYEAAFTTEACIWAVLLQLASTIWV